MNTPNTYVQDYNVLFNLLERQAQHMRDAEKHKRLAKVEWKQFFDLKREISKVKVKLDIPEDPCTFTKNLANQFNNC